MTRTPIHEMTPFDVACLDDYLWCVDNGLIADSDDEVTSFLAGYLSMEDHLLRLGWHRSPAPSAA